MKSLRSGTFFSSIPAAKKARASAKDSEAILPYEKFGFLPEDMWMEVLLKLDKARMHNMRQVSHWCRFLIDHNDLVARVSIPSPDHARLLLEKAIVRSRFSFKPFYGFEYFPLENGDVVVITGDGRVNVLELRQSAWRVYEPMPRAPLHAVREVKLLQSGYLATTSHEGISIWNRKTHKELQLLQVQSGFMFASTHRYFLELPNGHLASVTMDGNIHLWQQTKQTDSPFKYGKKLPQGPHRRLGTPKQLILCDKEIACECLGFLARWNLASGEFIERVDIAAIKLRLTNAMKTWRTQNGFVRDHFDAAHSQSFYSYGEQNNFNFRLSLDWSMPDGYAIAKIDNCFMFLFKPFDKSIAPFYLGQGEVKTQFTSTGDLVVASREKNSFVLAGWNRTNNTFAINRMLYYALQPYFLVTREAEVFFEISKSDVMTIYDIYTDTIRELPLGSPPELYRCITVRQQLTNGDWLGTYLEENTNESGILIWDDQTGQCKSRIKCSSGTGNISELTSGDLLNLTSDDKKAFVDIYRFGI